MIKVIFLSTSDNLGGAAKATLKLFKALSQFDIVISMWVKKKLTNEKGIRRVFTLFPATAHVMFDKFILSRYPNGKKNTWSLALLPNLFLFLSLKFTRYDILQLNWINLGFLPIALLRVVKKPIVWRLSDSWPFTGGCHIPQNCLKYTTGCGACPQLNSNNPKDLSYQVLSKKLKYWKNTNITIVAPSKWMANNARNSLLFKEREIVHIPTGINIDIFKPLDIRATRKKLGLPTQKKIILYGGTVAKSDPNKGFHLLVDSLIHFHSTYPNPKEIELVVFGHADKSMPATELIFDTTFVGTIGEPQLLNEYYAVSDVFILPSIMENSPNTVIESMGAGTPVVAFDACGTSELIDHLIDGYLAAPYSPQDLANGMMYILTDLERAKSLGAKGRQKVEQYYNITDIAAQYRILYNKLCRDS